MKSKIRRKKRVTFLRLFVSSVLLAFIVSFAFAFGLREYLYKDIRNKATTCLEESITQTMSKINQFNEKDVNAISQVDNYLSMYTHYYIDFTDFSDDYNAILASNITENCYAVSAIVDKDNNIVASNKEKLCTFLKLGEDESGLYTCDRERFSIPQLDELFEYYAEIRKDYVVNGSYEIILDSVYVNKSDFSFIPHECSIEVLKDVNSSADENGLYQYKTAETRDFVIELNDKDYELITLNQPPSKEAPRAFACGFYGTDRNIFDEVMSDVNSTDESISSRSFYNKNLNGKDLLHIESQNNVYIDGELYDFYTLFIVDNNAETIMQLYWKCVIIFTFILLAISLLLCWQQNVINKARYAFEDYQKALINNLAHDMKTPLTAIGGYAENAKKFLEKESLERVISFLDAITENVFYTDTIVNRTLELNHLNKIQEVKKELVQMHKIAEKSIEKYSLILDEKHITVELNGECELMADKATIESAIENLISNAVKYTSENGRILITADKNSLTIINDTADNVNTKNLTMPFVKGDKSRNEKSCGIGLAIAQSAAELNNLKLTISSSDNQFKAALIK